MKNIRTSFTLSSGGRAIDTSDEAWTMERLSQYIFSDANKNCIPGTDEYLQSAYSVLSNICLTDNRKREMYLDKQLFVPFKLGEVMFLCAQITEVNHYKKDCTHLFCKYVNAGGIYKGCFILPNSIFNQYEEQYGYGFEGIHYVIGTCIRKNYSVPAKTVYNKYAHMAVEVAPATIVQRNKLLAAYITGDLSYPEHT